MIASDNPKNCGLGTSVRSPVRVRLTTKAREERAGLRWGWQRSAIAVPDPAGRSRERPPPRIDGGGNRQAATG
jgi:hypothetical protein